MELHNEVLHNLYPSPDIRIMKPEKIRWAMPVARIGQMKIVYYVLGGKHEGRR
jgi:hypothetical protein